MNDSNSIAVPVPPERPKAPPPPPLPRNRHDRRAQAKKNRVLAQKKAAARKVRVKHQTKAPSLALGDYDRLSEETKARIAKGRVKFIDNPKNVTLSFVSLTPGDPNRIVLRERDPGPKGDGS